VLSSKRFDNLMKKEFEFVVTPIAFNLEFGMDDEGGECKYFLERGFGSPDVNGAMGVGHRVKIASEFPAMKNEKGETRGGMLLFNVKEKDVGNDVVALKDHITMWSKYETQKGIVRRDKRTFEKFPVEDDPFQDSEVRKAVLLVKYTDFVQRYLEVRNRLLNEGKNNVTTTIGENYYKDVVDDKNYKEQLRSFILWFQKEMLMIKDQNLDDELSFLVTIAQSDKVQIVADEKKVVEEETKQTDSENKPSELDTDGKHGVKRKRDEEQDRSCVVCMEKERKVLLLPCKHVCLCESCSVSVDVCPLCREMINSKTTVFI